MFIFDPFAFKMCFYYKIDNVYFRKHVEIR